MLTATQTTGRARHERRRTVNLSDAALELGIARSTLSAQARRGKLPFPTIKIGTRILVSREVLDRVLAGEYDGRPDEAA